MEHDQSEVATPLLDKDKGHASNKKTEWRLPSPLHLCMCGAVLYAVCTYLLLHHVPIKVDESVTSQIPEEVWSWTMVAFATALFMNVMTLLFQVGSPRMPPILIACYINIMACTTHYLYWRKIIPLVTDVWGHPFEANLEIMWMCVTPLMVFNLSSISDFSQKKVAWTMFADVWMILFGLGFRLIPHLPTAAACFWLSMLAFCYVLYNLWFMFDAPLSCTTTRTAERGLQIIRAYTIIFWNCFWVVELLQWIEWTPMWFTPCAYACLDIAGKVVFSSTLVLGNLQTMDERRHKAMQAVETTNKVAVINELQEVIDHKNNFLSSTSHELRTPLNGIMGLSEAILSGCCGEIPPQIVKTVSTIKSSGARLLNLVNDILDSASMLKGKLVVKHEIVHLKPLAEDVVDLCAPLVKKGVIITSDISAKLPPVLGDHGRIIQILYNLVGNSCKFTHNGCISISAGVADGKMQVHVTDTGVGIPKSKFNSIFQQFEQVDIGTTRKYGGTGLGLSLVKDLVLAHDGEIKVESEMDRGSTFTFTLPLHGGGSPSFNDSSSAPAAAGVSLQQSDEQTFSKSESVKDVHVARTQQQSTGQKTQGHAELQLTNPMPSSAQDNCPLLTSRPSIPAINTNQPHRKTTYKKTEREASGKVHVLSVDDDPINQLVVKNLLCTRPSVHQVSQAMNGEEALTMLRDGEHLPDVILLDIMMPGMNGFEVCRAFRNMYPDAGTVVIMLSAKKQEDNVVDGLRSGANDYVSKPFGRQELLARIDAHLQFHDVVRRSRVGFSETDEDGHRRSAANAPGSSFTSMLSVANSIVTPSSILTHSTRATLPLDLIPNLPDALRDLSNNMYQVKLDDIAVLNVAISNLSDLLDAHALPHVMAAVSSFQASIQDLLGSHNAYLDERLHGCSFNMLLGLDKYGSSEQVVAEAINLAAAVVEAASEAGIKHHAHMQVHVGVHIGTACAAVVDHEHPVLHFCGPAIQHALALRKACPSNCVHMSQAIINNNKGALTHSISVTEDSWLLKAGQWKDHVGEVQKKWDTLKSEQKEHGPYNMQCLASKPIQVALCYIAAAKPIVVWDAAIRMHSKGRKIKELEELRKAKLLLEEQMAEVAQECDRLQDEMLVLQDRLDETTRYNTGLARNTLTSLEGTAAVAYAALERELEVSHAKREEQLQELVKQAQSESKAYAQKEENLRASLCQISEKAKEFQKKATQLEMEKQQLEKELNETRNMPRAISSFSLFDGAVSRCGSAQKFVQPSDLGIDSKEDQKISAYNQMTTLPTTAGLDEPSNERANQWTILASAMDAPAQQQTNNGHNYNSPQQVMASYLLAQPAACKISLESVLAAAGLQLAIPNFVRNKVTLHMLPWLDIEMLRELGVETLGDRLRLYATINSHLLRHGASQGFIAARSK